MSTETILLGQQQWGLGNLKLNLKANRTPRYLPVSHEWPAEMAGDLVWGPTSFGSEGDYTLTLSEDDIFEVKAGLQHFNGEVKDIQE